MLVVWHRLLFAHDRGDNFGDLCAMLLWAVLGLASIIRMLGVRGWIVSTDDWRNSMLELWVWHVFTRRGLSMFGLFCRIFVAYYGLVKLL